MLILLNLQRYREMGHPGLWSPQCPKARHLGHPDFVGPPGAKTLKFLPMIQVWQVEIINTQCFEKYFSLMRKGLREFSTGEGVDRDLG